MAKLLAVEGANDLLLVTRFFLQGLLETLPPMPTYRQPWAEPTKLEEHSEGPLLEEYTEDVSGAAIITQD